MLLLIIIVIMLHQVVQVVEEEVVEVLVHLVLHLDKVTLVVVQVVLLLKPQVTVVQVS